ncbi:hypothetical protein LTR53_018926, partial [Teratosphaeriaceae sp. CCFEE 6253]
MATSGDLPSSFSTNNVMSEASPNGSQTISSRTAMGEDENATPVQQRRSLAPPAYNSASPAFHPTTPSQQQQLQHRSTGTQSRVRGAQRATLLPAEQALMPKPLKASWGTWLGASELIGTAVPRQQDGTFDHARASLYWR